MATHRSILCDPQAGVSLSSGFCHLGQARVYGRRTAPVFPTPQCHTSGTHDFCMEINPLLPFDRSPLQSASQGTHVTSSSSSSHDLKLSTSSYYSFPGYSVSLRDQSSQTEWAYKSKSGKGDYTLPGPSGQALTSEDMILCVCACVPAWVH